MGRARPYAGCHPLQLRVLQRLHRGALTYPWVWQWSQTRAWAVRQPAHMNSDADGPALANPVGAIYAVLLASEFSVVEGRGAVGGLAAVEDDRAFGLASVGDHGVVDAFYQLWAPSPWKTPMQEQSQSDPVASRHALLQCESFDMSRHRAT